MTIDGLNALTALTAGDELPVWDVEASSEEPTKKITAQNMAASVKSLGSLIGTGDLDSTPTQGSNKAVTSGGTYTAIQQSTAISEYGDIQITSATAGASLYGGANFYMRYNKVVFIHFGFKLENATVGKAYTIAINLPTSCQPPFSSSQSVVATNGNMTGAVNVNFNAQSGFTVYADKAGTTYAIGTIMYLIS